MTTNGTVPSPRAAADLSAEELRDAHSGLLLWIDRSMHALRSPATSMPARDSASCYLLRDAARLRELYAEASRRGVTL